MSMMARKTHSLTAVSCVWLVAAPLVTAWATSPYDQPYGVQWSFMIGNDRADNPNMCVMSPDGSVWIGTGGTGNTSSGGAALTWGNPGTSYGGSWASGYGQISPLGKILQGNDWPLVPGLTGGDTYNQGYTSTIGLVGSNAFVSIKSGRKVLWANASPADTSSGGMKPATFKISPLTRPYDYDGLAGGNLPIANAAGIDVARTFTHDFINPEAGMGSAHDMAMGADESYYIVGQTQGIDTNLPPPDIFTIGDFSGPTLANYKPFVGRVSADGLTLYGPTHQPAATGRAGFFDVAINEATGRVYAAGFSSVQGASVPTYFDPDGPGPLPTVNFDAGRADAFTGFALVYDATTWAVQQTVIWTSSPAGGEGCFDITATPDNGFVVCGTTEGHMGGHINPAPGTRDGYIEKYNADGSLAWNHQTRTAYYDYYGDATVDPDGNVYVSGFRDLTGTEDDPFLTKFAPDGTLVWTSIIDNEGTHESAVDHANIDKYKVYLLSEAKPYGGNGMNAASLLGTLWGNTISYSPQGTDEVLLQKLSPGDFNDGTTNATPDGFVNFDDVQYAGSRVAPGLPGVDTFDFDDDGHSTLADAYFMISNVMDRVVGDVHPGEASELYSDVDNADIGRAIGGYTGSGGSGMHYLDGDIDFDGNVDDDDIAYVVGAFTGALAPDRKRTPPSTGTARIYYGPGDGLVLLSAWPAAGGIITSFQLENTQGTFVQTNYHGLSSGSFGGSLQDVTSSVIADTDLTFTGFGGVYVLGKIFPIGMTNEVDLAAFLSTAVYTGEAGSGQKAFSLVMLSDAVPTGLLFHVR